MRDILFSPGCVLRSRQLNSRRIFCLVYKEPGISRTELQERTFLSKNSVTGLVDEMLVAGLLSEGEACNGGSSLGRKRIGLFLQAGLFYVVSAVFNIDEPEIALINAAGQSVHSLPLQHSGSGQADLFIAEILSKTAELLRLVPHELVLGAVVSLPGIFDAHSGNVYSSQAFSMRNEVINCKKLFQEHFGMQLALYNDTNLRAANEKFFGAAREMDNFICVDEGLGLGMFMNGRLYRGWQGNAGELGLMKITEGSQLGMDGRKGLLYEKAIFKLVGERVFKVIESGGNIQIDPKWKADQYLPPKAIVKAAQNGNLFVAQLFTEIFNYIGDAIVNVAYLLNPQAVFLPAWCKQVPQYSLDVVRMKMGSYGMSNWHLKCQVLIAEAKNASRPRAQAKLYLEGLIEQLNENPKFFLPHCQALNMEKKPS